MARPLTGSIKHTRSGTYEASIATASVDPNTTRASSTFPSRDAAERWLATARSCLEAGFLPPDPAAFRKAPSIARPTPNAQMNSWSFEDAAWRWFRFHYYEQRRADAERAMEVAGILRNHVLPYFGARLWTIADLRLPEAVRIAEYFPAVLAGQAVNRHEDVRTDDELLTVREILALPGLRNTRQLAAREQRARATRTCDECGQIM